MTLEGSRWGDKQVGKMARAEENTRPLNDIADGYIRQAEEIFNSPAAVAVRHEVKNYLSIESLEPQEQFDQLTKLARSLEAYKFMSDIDNHATERAAFALALIRREKGLQ